MEITETLNELQALYDSEINFVISTFWDAGFDWKLGDEMNGYKADGCGDSVAEAVEQIKAAALVHFPASVFTQAYRRRQG